MTGTQPYYSSGYSGYNRAVAPYATTYGTTYANANRAYYGSGYYGSNYYGVRRGGPLRRMFGR